MYRNNITYKVDDCEPTRIDFNVDGHEFPVNEADIDLFIEILRMAKIKSLEVQEVKELQAEEIEADTKAELISEAIDNE